MENEDIRWRQRFQNFARAFKLLRASVEDEAFASYSDLEREGVVQRFEYTFELAWKTFKDYLEYGGVRLTEATPRKVIKECAERLIFEEAGIVPEIFLEMMLARNALSHRYDSEYFKEVAEKIKTRYAAGLEKAYLFFTGKELEADEPLGLK
jgi:nucleotidyltransferase substrate binding protein (TIGR01987 family)